MIEPSAVVYRPDLVSDDAYIGHYAIVGHPRRVRPDLTIPDGGEPRFWEEPTGVRIMRRAVVGPRAHIDDGTMIEPGVWIGGGCRIGHDTRIAELAEVYYACQVYDRVVIERGATVAGFVCNDARIGARAQVYGSLIHRLVNAPPTGADPRPGETEAAPVVEDDAIVGLGAIVIGGVRVGNGAYIAAGAVLTRDAEPGVLYVGAPAKAAGPAPEPIAKAAPGHRATRRTNPG